MKWREKLNKMAMIDILYMLSDNSIKMHGHLFMFNGVCIKELFVGDVGPCDFECHKCLERFLNEEVERKNQNDDS